MYEHRIEFVGPSVVKSLFSTKFILYPRINNNLFQRLAQIFNILKPLFIKKIYIEILEEVQWCFSQYMITIYSFILKSVKIIIELCASSGIHSV